MCVFLIRICIIFIVQVGGPVAQTVNQEMSSVGGKRGLGLH